MNDESERMPADSVICAPSILNQIWPRLNIPFIHMNYGKDPYGTHNTERERERERECV